MADEMCSERIAVRGHDKESRLRVDISTHQVEPGSVGQLHVDDDQLWERNSKARQGFRYCRGLSHHRMAHFTDDLTNHFGVKQMILDDHDTHITSDETH